MNFLKHTADIKFQVFGKSTEEVFSNSALALTNIICKEKIKPVKKARIKTKSRDMKRLLYEFLVNLI